MRNLILTPLLAALAGCVSYYYPYGEPVEGVRYVPAEEYVENVYYQDEVIDTYDYSDIYVSSPYYPWWSIDYFYLGSQHRHNGFSFGLSYGAPRYWDSYSSYYDPFYPSYGFSPWVHHYSPFSYSIWYSPFYDRPYRHFGGRHHFGHHYFWRNRFDRYHGSPYRDRDRHAGNRRGHHDDNPSTLRPGHNDWPRDDDRYASDRGDRNDRRRRGEDGPVGDGRDPRRGGPGTDGLQRHTSVGAGKGMGQRGVEIRNRQDRKPKPSRMEPVNPVGNKPVVKLNPADGVKVAPPGRTGLINSRGPNGKIRSRARSKYDNSRVTAVKPRPYSYGDGQSSAVSNGISTSNRGAMTVLSPSERKPQGTRIQPSKPSVSSASGRSPVVTYRPPKTDQRGGRVINSRKPIASLNSKPARPAPAIRVQPVQPAVRSQPVPTAKPQFRNPPRQAPARQHKPAPVYSPPARQQSRPTPPPEARPAARPNKPERARPTASSENKGGSRRSSGRKER